MEEWMYELYSEDVWGNGNKYNTIEEAIKAGREEARSEGVDSFWVGKAQPYVLSENIIDAEIVLERISENVYEDMGEVAEDYLCDVDNRHINELEISLNKVFHEWIKKHKYEHDFWQIVDVRKINVEESEDDGE